MNPRPLLLLGMWVALGGCGGAPWLEAENSSPTPSAVLTRLLESYRSGSRSEALSVLHAQGALSFDGRGRPSRLGIPEKANGEEWQKEVEMTFLLGSTGEVGDFSVVVGTLVEHPLGSRPGEKRKEERRFRVSAVLLPSADGWKVRQMHVAAEPPPPSLVPQ